MEEIMNLQLLAEGAGGDGDGGGTSAPALAKGIDVRGHFDSLQRQGQDMAGKYAGFDLQKELDNPMFFKLTGPHVGLSVEDAYMAVHHRELTRAIAEGTRRELTNAIRAGANRPGEHGIAGTAPTVTSFDYRNADRAQRKAFKQEIYRAAARGEKIYPG